MAITTEHYQGQLTTAAVAVLSSGAQDVFSITKALITNNSTTVAYTFTIYDDNAGSGATTANIVQNAVTISPKETKVLPLSALSIQGGGKLWALASANSVLNLSITYSRTTN